MIKYIFCDLDGTLYNNGISNDDIDSISNFEKNGVFNVATGRIFKQGYKMVKDYISLNGYFICENGSFIYDNNFEIIFKGTLDDDIAKRVIRSFENIEINKSADAQIYFKYKGETVILEESKAFSHYSKDYIIDPEFTKKESFDNMIGNIGVACEDEKELARIEKILIDEFGNELDIYFSSESTINIVPMGVSKESGINFVIEKENISHDEIATIGDSPNDISMLKGFKYSFAMENGRDDVKESASYVVKNVSEAISIINSINSR